MQFSITELPALPPSGTAIERQVLEVLRAEVMVRPTGVSRETYLDVMEKLIRVAADWQDPDGAMIDPVQKVETGQTSPRFVAAAAVLLHFGRCGDLRERVYRGMDYCCRRLSGGEAQSPDFWMRELVTAWMMIESGAPADRRAAWAKQLRGIDPEKTHWYVEKPDQPIEALHNWVVYGAAGEGLREIAGLAHADPAVKSGRRFWDKYMPAQLNHFSDDGMYRDPGDPMTYDMTTRLQLATPLAFGLKTPIDPQLHELLRRGALAELLYASPEGLAPFGGRSAAFHLQECIFAAIGELEARRYRAGHPKLAGAFKRHARLGVGAIRRWIDMTPHRHLKNGFAPEAMHGCEGYAGYAVYTCFAASCLGLAALWADESIAESATPAEVGGYVVEFKPAFHKILACCGGTQVEIDTAADPQYDATGLGRFHRAGVPLELGLGMPMARAAKYKLPLPPKAAAIGPAWRVGDQWTTLAGLGEGLDSTLTIEQCTREQIRFHVDWRHGETRLRETYDLTLGRLRLQAVCPAAGAMRMTVPLLQGDGDATSTIAIDPGSATVTYRDQTLHVTFADPTPTAHDTAGNRHGVYRLLQVEQPGTTAVVELLL